MWAIKSILESAYSIYRAKNEPPKVVGFCMRDDLEEAVAKLKKKKF